MKRILLAGLLALALPAIGQNLDKAYNFAISNVSAGYDAAATSITLSTGGGARFGDPSTDGPFFIVWWNSTDYPGDPSSDPNREIVRCTARSADVLTVTRGQDGTSASTKNTGGKTYTMMQALVAGMWNSMRDTVRGVVAAKVGLPSGSGDLPVGVNGARDSLVEWKVGGSVVKVGRSYELSGDAASPGNTKLYGTDGTGAKGWYDQPTGGSPAFNNVTSGTNTTASMHVGTGATLDWTGTGAVDANKIFNELVSIGGRAQAAHRFSALVHEEDSAGYVHRKILVLNMPTTLGSGYFLYVDTDSTIKAAAVPTSAVWGNITGTLSNQSDLNTALGGKAASGANTDLTRITSLTGTAPQLTLGANTGALGEILLNGSTSGGATIHPPAAAGSPTLTLPTVTGTLMQFSETSISSNATWAPTGDARQNFYDVTAQAAAATTISNPSGTASNHNVLYMRIKDNGTARAMTWSGSQWRASSDLALPTTTIVNKTMYLRFMFNSTDTKWDFIGYLDNF